MGMMFVGTKGNKTRVYRYYELEIRQNGKHIDTRLSTRDHGDYILTRYMWNAAIEQVEKHANLFIEYADDRVQVWDPNSTNPNPAWELRLSHWDMPYA